MWTLNIQQIDKQTKNTITNFFKIIQYLVLDRIE